MFSRLLYCLPHLVMLALSVMLYAAAIQIDTAHSGGRIGPDFWPKAVILFMGLLCLYEVIKRLVLGRESKSEGLPDGALPHRASGNAAEGKQDASDAPAAPEYPHLLLAGTALIVGYVVIVPWLGFFLTTALFLSSFAWVGGFRRPAWIAAISLGGALLMVVVFMRVAYISLPLGQGPFHTLSVALLSVLGVR